MTASDRRASKQETRKKKGANVQAQGGAGTPLTPTLIIQVGIAVVHNMPEGCTRLPAPLLQETLITASQLTGNQARTSRSPSSRTPPSGRSTWRCVNDGSIHTVNLMNRGGGIPAPPRVREA